MNQYDIRVPLANPTNVKYILASCLKPHKKTMGTNTNHSKTIKLANYRPPINGNITENEMYSVAEKYSLSLLKHYAKKCLQFLKDNNCNLNIPVCKYIEEFSNQEITGNDLLFIINTSSEQLLKISRSNSETPLAKYLENFTNYGGIMDDDHYTSSMFYKDNYEPEEGEFLYGSGLRYSKRIYMNTPRNSLVTLQFGYLYIKKCSIKYYYFSF